MKPVDASMIVSDLQELDSEIYKACNLMAEEIADRLEGENISAGALIDIGKEIGSFYCEIKQFIQKMINEKKEG